MSCLVWVICLFVGCCGIVRLDDFVCVVALGLCFSGLFVIVLLF